MRGNVDGLSRVLAILALAISAGGLFLGGRTAWLDRRRIRAEVRYEGDPMVERPSVIQLKVVSIGRRPVRLAGLRLLFERDNAITWVRRDLAGLLLEEHGELKAELDPSPSAWGHVTSGAFPVDFKLIDIGGKTYRVKGSRRALEIIHRV